MRQHIEKNRETKLVEASVTVMFRGSQFVLGHVESLRTFEIAAPSLSDLLAVQVAFVPGASSLSPDLRSPNARSILVSPNAKASANADRKVFRGGANGSLRFGRLGGHPNTRGTQAASTVTTPMTEQRRCAAA